MCLVLREPQAGVETWLPQIRATLAGESQRTTISPQVAQVAQVVQVVQVVGGILQQVGQPPTIYPRMVASPGGRKNQLVGKILTSSQHPRAGESNPRHPTTGATVEEAIIQETGENQRRTKRAPLTLHGKEENKGAGRKTHEAGGHLLQDLVYLELEEMGAGENQLPSALVVLLKDGQANLRMDPVVIVEQEAWALGVAQAQ